MKTDRAAGTRVPEELPEPFRAALVAACEAWSTRFGEQLVSLVLFGSVARHFRFGEVVEL